MPPEVEAIFGSRVQGFEVLGSPWGVRGVLAGFRLHSTASGRGSSA